MKKAVQFGAGNIGRGFTGQLFSESGFEVVFVDVVEEIVQGLNRERCYAITVAGEPEEVTVVKNVRALDGRNIDAVADEVAQCDIASTAVGVNVLGTVAVPIARGLEQRKLKNQQDPLNIIVCENMRDAAGALREKVAEKISPDLIEWMDEHVGFVQAVVGRMVPVRTDEERAEDPLGIRVEAYKKLPIDADAVRGDLPEITGIIAKPNFQAYIDQKLFAHNAGHAVSAYFGALRNLTYIWECMEDEWVRSQTEGVMRETGEALIKRYGLDPDEHWAHVSDLLTRFANKKLGDTVARVGGDPVRKLGKDDRLVGAALFCQEQGIKPVCVAKAIAAGLHYTNPDDNSAVEIQQKISKDGVESVLKDICGIDAQSELGTTIVQSYKQL